MSLIIFIAGIAELSIRPCVTHYYNYGKFHEKRCMSAVTIGQSMWCSVFVSLFDIFK